MAVGLTAAPPSVGVIATSTSPTGGPGAWHAIQLGAPISTVSCPTASLCVAVDIHDNVLTSTNPAGGPSAWTIAPLPAADAEFAALPSIDCPSSTLCVEAGAAHGGVIQVSSDPAGGAATWTATTPGAFGNVGEVSCPTSTMCAIANVGFVNPGILISTDPAGGAASWTSWPLDPVPRRLSCPTSTLCVGAAASPTTTIGLPVTAIHLTAGAVTGQSAVDLSPLVPGIQQPATIGALTDVSCPTAGLCAVSAFASGPSLAGPDSVFTSAEPTGPIGAWHLAQITSPGLLTTANAVDCPATTLCVMVDQNADVLTSTRPLG